MKRLLLACTIVFSTAGCLHTIDYREDPNYRCAEAGQIYEGFTITGRNGGAEDVGQLRCAKPKTDEDRCVVKAARDNKEEADKFNNDWRPKNIVVGVGYAFWFVPGVVAYYMWHDENEKEYRDFVTSTKETYEGCVAH